VRAAQPRGDLVCAGCRGARSYGQPTTTARSSASVTRGLLAPTNRVDRSGLRLELGSGGSWRSGCCRCSMSPAGRL